MMMTEDPEEPTRWIAGEPSSPRSLESLRILSMGYLPRKREIVNLNRQGHWAVGLVTAGAGWFERGDGSRLEAQAPFVFNIWPGGHFLYGAPESSEWWTERFVVFSGSRVEEWVGQGWLVEDLSPVALSPGLADQLAETHEQIGQALQGVGMELNAAKLALENWIYTIGRERARPAEDHPIDALIRQWRRNPPLPEDGDLEAVAAGLGLSYSHFRAEFRRLTGTSPGRFLQVQRIERAANLLTSGTCSIKEAAFETGFRHLESFHRAFRRIKGLSPAQYTARSRRLIGG